VARPLDVILPCLVVSEDGRGFADVVTTGRGAPSSSNAQQPRRERRRLDCSPSDVNRCKTQVLAGERLVVRRVFGWSTGGVLEEGYLIMYLPVRLPPAAIRGTGCTHSTGLLLCNATQPGSYAWPHGALRRYPLF
jgi:hypothetical protein